jgi:tetratricopeptide (TPR) repeat protein
MSSRLESLQQFLNDDPNDTFTHYAIALEYVSLKQFSDAVAKFESIIKIDPIYIPAYHQLGLLFAQLNRKEEAIDVFERGIKTATTLGDMHACSEMQEELDELL